MENIIILQKDELENILKKTLDSVMSRFELKKPEKVNNVPEDFITRKELLAKLKCSDVKLWQMMSRKEIPYYKFGRNVYFKLSEISESLYKSEAVNKVIPQGVS